MNPLADHHENNEVQGTPDIQIQLAARVCKMNEDQADCEDALSLDLENRRLAISDGATQSFYAGLWSDLLVTRFCSDPTLLTTANWKAWIRSVQEEWLKAVEVKAKSLKLQCSPTWIESENGLTCKRPAYATFLGVHLTDGYINGIGLGDSCIFICKKKMPEENTSKELQLAKVFPLEWKAEFTNRTQGFGSYPHDCIHAPESFSFPVDQDGETWIMMMTDALASHLLSAEEHGESLLNQVLKITTLEGFESFVDQERSKGMNNDDTTLLIVSLALGDSPRLKDSLAPLERSLSIAEDALKDQSMTTAEEPIKMIKASADKTNRCHSHSEKEEAVLDSDENETNDKNIQKSDALIIGRNVSSEEEPGADGHGNYLGVESEGPNNEKISSPSTTDSPAAKLKNADASHPNPSEYRLTPTDYPQDDKPKRKDGSGGAWKISLFPISKPFRELRKRLGGQQNSSRDNLDTDSQNWRSRTK